MSGPLTIGLNIGTFDGVNTTLTGFSLGNFNSGRIDGSGNFSVTSNVVPEPTSLVLLGSGLVALGWVRRTRQH